MAPERPTVWIDTCVLIDFETTISMGKNQNRGDVAAEATRVAMQRAAWAAMAFDHGRVLTQAFAHEVERNLVSKAPSMTVQGFWTHVVHTFVWPHVCPGWGLVFTGKGGEIVGPDGTRDATNDERDEYMLRVAKVNQLTLVTSDGRALRKAKAAGISACEPHVYAERVIPFVVASEIFRVRLACALSAYVEKQGSTDSAHDYTCIVWNWYARIWGDPRLQPWLPAIPRSPALRQKMCTEVELSPSATITIVKRA